MEGTLKEIKLNGGRHTILIDDEDYPDFMEASGGWKVTGTGNSQVVRTGPTKGPFVNLHHYIMCPGEGKIVIFKSDNRLDFRKKNLQITDWSHVGHIKKVPSRQSKAGYRGVSKYGESWKTKHGDMWAANIFKDGKTQFLGLYIDITHAARAYNIAAKEIFGDMAHQNDVPDDIIPIRYEFKTTLERVTGKIS